MGLDFIQAKEFFVLRIEQKICVCIFFSKTSRKIDITQIKFEILF
jgi:hypothetical protein